ncbi:MAG TPA: ribonuclease D [Gemmatimonadales bacterium]|nr:ribonuclease D [Gemmatimonadales bacterium]
MSDTDSKAAAINHILTGGAFDALIGRFQDAPLLAVDTEAASFHRYRDRIYLIQLSSRSETAVVDPLAVHDLARLGALLSDPAIEIIFHDADYDLRILDRDYGFHAVNLFDTRIAAQLLNEPGIGLAALLEKYVGVKLDKRFQRADWSVRPLKPGMLQYAADDTRFLPVLRDLLKERLVAADRWSWASEEFELLEGVRWNAAGPPEEAYLRMKGARSLKGPQLAVLRAVFEWRERMAAQLDRAQFRIVHNDTLLAIAKAQPRTPGALQEAAHLSPDLIRRWGEGILDAVEGGLAAPQSSIPVFERSRRPPPDPERDARLERLKTARNAIAQRLDLAPGVLCANGLLEAIANQNPHRLEELEAIPDMRRWQRKVLGKELIAAANARS